MDVLSLNSIKDIDNLRKALNTELKSAAVSFVRIGYLLKTARDTDILKDTEYADVNEFASNEFGLDKSQVSRFMAINDRFSIGGYSEHLEDKYAEFGSSKLSLMLLLPDSINEQLSPEYSKSDIQSIKEEYQAEQKISDLEVMMEAPAEQPQTKLDEFLALIIKQMIAEHEGPAKTIKWGMDKGIVTKSTDVWDAYCPSGDTAYNIRIPGTGRFLVSCKEAGVVITNMRSDESSPVGWEDFKDILVEQLQNVSFEQPEPEPEKKPKKVEPSKVAKKEKTERNTQRKEVKDDSKKDSEVKKIQESDQTGTNLVQEEPEVKEESSDQVETILPEDKSADEDTHKIEQSSEENNICQSDILPKAEADIHTVEASTEAAGFKFYGKFMNDTRSARIEASKLIGVLEDNNRLVNDVPPLNERDIEKLMEASAQLSTLLQRIKNIWTYYESTEEEEDDD